MTVAKRAAKAAPESPKLTVRQLNRAFLARQMLLSRNTRGALDCIRALMGLQAQVPRPPFIGLWTRLQDFSADELRGLLQRRQVVRVTTMRGTLHLMTTDDYLEYRGTLQPMLTRGAASILRDWMSDADVVRFDSVGRDFFGKTPATFDTLRDVLTARDPKSDVRAMAYGIRCHVPLVQVPSDAPWGYPSSADFVLADTYLKRKVVLKPGSLDSFVRRYLAAFGPATPADAQAWSAIPGLKATFDSLRASLVAVRDERGRELFDLPESPRPTEDVTAPVRFIRNSTTWSSGTTIVPESSPMRIAEKSSRRICTYARPFSSMDSSPVLGRLSARRTPLCWSWNLL